MLEGITSNPVMDKLQAAITFTARRHEVIVNNVANVTTPGFRAKDLSETNFLDAMKRADGDLEEALKVVDSPDAGPARNDGNNVSMEAEMSKLSKNAMMHNILVSMLDKQFRMLETALRERIV